MIFRTSLPRFLKNEYNTCQALTGNVQPKEAMKGIYTTCINKGTLDESLMAYKPIDEIVGNIEPKTHLFYHILLPAIVSARLARFSEKIKKSRRQAKFSVSVVVHILLTKKGGLKERH